MIATPSVTAAATPSLAANAVQPAGPAPTTAPTLAAPEPTRALPLVAQVGVHDNNVFSPATVTIAAGGSVTWTWDGNAFHNVSSSTFASDPAGVKKSGSYTVTFAQPGTYTYACEVHVSVGMTGTVVVR